MDKNSVLQALQIQSDNLGTCTGSGQWLSGKKQEKLVSINPANEETIATVYLADQHAYETVIQDATQAFLSWREVPAPKRGELVRKMAEALRANKDWLGTLVSMEMGKSKEEGDGEVQEMIDIADFAVGQARMLYGKSMHSERFQHRMYEQWQPLGVVGVISAFNFPVAVWAWNAFIAAVCGNTVIWKPANDVPLCAIAVQKLCNQVMQEAGFSGVFSLFISSNDIAEQFVCDQRVALVSFTGSCRVGKHVASLVANRMGKYLLELGGNNAVIIDRDADLQLAIPAIVFGAVGTAGQRCTSTRRLIVHDTIFSEVVQRLCHAYAQVSIGDPLDKRRLMGPLINAKAVEQFEAAMKAIQQQGGDVLSGGARLPGPGYYVQPTIVKVTPEMPIVQEETFAPILYVMPYQQLEDAISIQNSVRQGLSSAIFTGNLQKAEQFLSSCGSDCGIANVNIGTSGAEIGGAFGGEKETGGGREAGSDSWKVYMRRQTTTINWSNDMPLAQGIQFSLKA